MASPVASTGSVRTDTGWAKAATGCGDFTILVTHASKRKFLHVYSSRAALGLKRAGDTATLPLDGGAKSGLAIDVYPAPGGDEYYCSDIGRPDAPRKSVSLPAMAGTVSIKLTSFRSDHDFIVQLTLQGVSVRTEDGGIERIPDATYSDVHVGWLPG